MIKGDEKLSFQESRLQFITREVSLTLSNIKPQGRGSPFSLSRCNLLEWLPATARLLIILLSLGE